MVAVDDWSSVSHAGAFLIGALLATIATLRVMRYITNFFAGLEQRRHRRRPDNDPPDA